MIFLTSKRKTATFFSLYASGVQIGSITRSAGNSKWLLQLHGIYFRTGPEYKIGVGVPNTYGGHSGKVFVSARDAFLYAGSCIQLLTQPRDTAPRFYVEIPGVRARTFEEAHALYQAYRNPPMAAQVPCTYFDENRNWADEEQYECRCCSCKQAFLGHKRRAVCRECIAQQALKVEFDVPVMLAAAIPQDALDNRVELDDYDKTVAGCAARYAAPANYGGWPSTSVDPATCVALLAKAATLTGHVLYAKGDPDLPAGVQDANGDVTLGLCRKCGRGEIELSELCTTPVGETQADHAP